MDFYRRYDSLHKRYLELKGDEFDLHDIENASISYAYNTCGIEGNLLARWQWPCLTACDEFCLAKQQP